MQKELKSDGFTLIELLVVISIMVILIGLSAFGLQQARLSARDGQRKADLETIRTGLSFYKADCNVYPTPAATTSKLSTTLVGNTTICSGSANTYIQKVPSDPVTANNYFYSSSANGYSICASLENGGTATDTTSCNTAGATCGGTCNYYVTNP